MIRKTAFSVLLLLIALAIGPMEVPLSGQAQEAAAAPQVTTVTLWHGEDWTWTFEELVTAFMIMNPGITVNLEYKDDLYNDFMTAASGGGGPDLVYGPNDWISPLAEAGLIQVMDDQFDPDDFVEQAAAGAAYQGHYWGVPNTFGNHLMLFYNKALLGTAPADTTEMINVAKGLTGGGQYGLIYNLAEPFWLVPWLTGFGGWVLDDSLDPPFPTLDTPEMVGALQFIYDLRYEHAIVPDGDVDYDTADILFRNGMAAMMINGDWTLNSYRDQFGDADLGVARIPLVTGTGLWPQPMVSGKYFLINANSSGDELAASQAFIQYATSKSPQLIWPEETGMLPALLEAFNDPAVQGDPILQASADQAALGRLMPTSEAMGCIWDAMDAMLPLLWDDLVTPDAAAEGMQSEAGQCYAEIARQSLFLPVIVR